MSKILALLLLCNLAFTQELLKKDTLEDTMIPYTYVKRTKAELNIALMYYGDAVDEAHLAKIGELLKERFYKAVDGLLTLNIVNTKSLTYKYRSPQNYVYGHVTDPVRLQRIWYYENVGLKILKEVYDQYKFTMGKGSLKNLDALAVVTGAQFDGLGFASGRVLLTEYPREIAWALDDGGRVEYPSDYQIVDELIHELGHSMFLGHAAPQCQKQGMSYKERQACCAKSANRNDVMSYCRNRAAVDENFMHKFEKCNLDMIKNLVIPSMLKGGKWNVSGRVTCK